MVLLSGGGGGKNPLQRYSLVSLTKRRMSRVHYHGKKGMKWRNIPRERKEGRNSNIELKTVPLSLVTDCREGGRERPERGESGEEITHDGKSLFPTTFGKKGEKVISNSGGGVGQSQRTPRQEGVISRGDQRHTGLPRPKGGGGITS